MKKLLCSLLCLGLFSSGVIAQDSDAKFEYKKTPVKGSISMLHGAGGNIGILESDEGLLVVDDGFDRNSEALESALGGYSGTTKYLLNTHWHGDHTGANAALGETTIVAHDNVRVRLAEGSNSGGRVVEPAPAIALPDITHTDGMTIHFGGQDISVVHFPNSHTDGDSVIFFEPANVVHMGDLMFAGYFPFVHAASGGTVAGYTQSVGKIIARINADTIVIPGHGDITDIDGVKRFHAMLVDTSATVSAMKSQGKSLEEAIKTGLSSEWDGWGDFFITEERWITTIWEDLDK